jgi:hypothetical protein
VTPTRVYLTVDVECAEERVVRGRRQPPLGYDARVWGRFRNHARELGIGLLMDELEACGHRGTFFVEPFAAHHFGLEGLAAICGALRGRGHDVQLHAHPIQRRPDFLSRGELPLPDDMARYSLDEQAALLEEGIGLLGRAGVPRDEILAFRAGNFGASNDTWAAMRRVGLRVSSNLNACYLDRNCKIRWPRTEQSLFDTGIGVWELPVSTFVEPDGGSRHLQIVAVSLGEMVSFLRQARGLGLRDVVVVTHSFELYYAADPTSGRAQLSRINLRRLRGLCRFLAAHRGEFVVKTVGDVARELPGLAAGSVLPVDSPRGARFLRYGRLVEQAIKRAATGFRLRNKSPG